MVLLDSVSHFERKSIACKLLIRRDTPFARDGRVHAVVSLEYMAQAAAAWAGMKFKLDGQQQHQRGFLVSVPSMRLHVSHFSVGDELTVRARCEIHASSSAKFNCQIERGQDVVAEAELMVVSEPA
jgi:predicted hotdog family 3-hydroxylacyl-ACP dehydratase